MSNTFKEDEVMEMMEQDSIDPRILEIKRLRLVPMDQPFEIIVVVVNDKPVAAVWTAQQAFDAGQSATKHDKVSIVQTFSVPLYSIGEHPLTPLRPYSG